MSIGVAGLPRCWYALVCIFLRTNGVVLDSEP